MKRLLSLLALAVFLVVPLGQALAADSMTCWFPPGWKNKSDQARTIAKALSDGSGVQVRPRIAKSYPEILSAFSTADANLVYVGSFVQAVIRARNLGTPLAQSITGKEFYSGVLVYPKGQDPAAILKNSPTAIAFAKGASSGESSAKAATVGKAAIGVPNHGAACGAVKAGKAKAAVVKNWWWQANQQKFPSLAMYEIPGISKQGNPDNVLTASKAVSSAVRKKLAAAAMKNPKAFGAQKMGAFNGSALQFSLELMAKGNIDPMSYSW